MRVIHRILVRPRWIELGGLALSLLTTMAACGSPTGPTTANYALAAESAHFRYYFGSGDHVDSDWEEQYHAWATAQLGVTLPEKISYYKYLSRQDMGARTGHYDTNGFAITSQFEIHTLFSRDNHEVVHVYSSLYGQPSNFFNEGMAVAFQMDPVAGDFVARFNGLAVHDACRQYLASGTLVLPLDRIASGTDFNSVSDSVLAYREAGSFVRFAIDRYGLSRMIQFFRISTSNESLATVKSHFLSAFGVSLEEAEQEWLTMLRGV